MYEAATKEFCNQHVITENKFQKQDYITDQNKTLMVST